MKSSVSLAPLKALLLIIALTAISIAPGCIIAANKQNEKKVEKTVSIPEFSSVSASAGIKVIYTQGKSTGIAKITTTESGEKYLKVEVKDGCLKLYYDSRQWKKGVNINGPTIVTVQSPTLKKVSLSSAASLQANGVINQSDMIEFNLSSAAEATVNSINCDNLQADLSSSASLSVNSFSGTNLTLVGSSASSASFDKATCKGGTWLHTSSAASISIKKITGENLSGEASSGSEIIVDNINCQTVDGNASSGASINLSGKCNSINKKSSSGGEVNTGNLSSNHMQDDTRDVNKEYISMALELREEAEKVRKEALASAKEIRKEALATAKEARKEAIASAKEARKEALASAKEAREEARIAREEARKASKAVRKKNKSKKNQTESSEKSETEGYLRIP